jgi:hypothetical protein
MTVRRDWELVPLPTKIEEMDVGRRLKRIPSEVVMWEVAPESITQGEDPWTDICWRAAISPAWSHVRAWAGAALNGPGEY